MKAFGKFLLLLAVVLGITFFAWKLLETSLFNDEDELAPPVSGVVVPAQTTQSDPPPYKNRKIYTKAHLPMSLLRQSPQEAALPVRPVLRLSANSMT